MKLLTGDVVEIKVCKNPSRVYYLLNGLPFDSADALIKEFLYLHGLYTPDTNEYTILHPEVRVYKYSLLTRLGFYLFAPVYYYVSFNGSYHIRVIDATGHRYNKEVRVLADTLNTLVDRELHTQNRCIVYTGEDANDLVANVSD